MRTLRPDRLFHLPSGLWVVDETQPVAAVLDPDTGELRRLVSWPDLPPAGSGDAWPANQALTDGSCLWAQQEASGPLVRVGLDGVSMAAWTGGLMLAACGPGVAWCASAPPGQELVAGPDPHPVGMSGLDRLLRVGADGTCRSVYVDGRVRDVRADEDGLLVEVDVEGWALRSLGADLSEVVRASRWLRLPWHADLPDRLSEPEHGLPTGFVPGPGADPGGAQGSSLRRDNSRPADPIQQGLGLTWRVGSLFGPSGSGRRAVVTAHDATDREVRAWDLGVGGVRTAVPVADRLCVVLAPQARTGPTLAPAARVVLLDATDPAGPTELLPQGGIDIAGHCWPLAPQPIDAESYLAQTLAANRSLDAYWHTEPDADGAVVVRPIADGLSGARTALVSNWPNTHLQWTFSHNRYPGLVLRRRVPLFDELGRPDPPEHADIYLMEDLDTGHLPPASDAREGVLDS